MRHTLFVLLIPITMACAGCCCLRIPSVRYAQPEMGCDTLPGGCSTCATSSERCVSCGPDVSPQQPHLLEPLGRLVPPALANWHPFQAWAERSNQPEWPRFHPIPHRPALAPDDVCNPDQTLVYGRFGEVQATYLNPPAAMDEPMDETPRMPKARPQHR